MAARSPMIATTIMISTSVKPAFTLLDAIVINYFSPCLLLQQRGKTHFNDLAHSRVLPRVARPPYCLTFLTLNSPFFKLLRSLLLAVRVTATTNPRRQIARGR